MADTVLAVSRRPRRKAGDGAMVIGANSPKTILPTGCSDAAEVAVQRASEPDMTTLHEHSWGQTSRRH